MRKTSLILGSQYMGIVMLYTRHWLEYDISYIRDSAEMIESTLA